MSAALPTPGRCPLCEGPAPTGQACSEPICARKGYHAVAEADFDQLKASRRPIDPQIGVPIGPWLPVGQLGAGAFGVVYRVRSDDGRMGALKVLARRDDDAARAAANLRKFQLEAEALAALDHPNIVQLLDVGTAHDQPYLVMEFVQGGKTLKGIIDSHVAEGRPLQAALVWHVVRQILSALGSAHAPPRSIVHRDIKPENIMLCESDGDPAHVKVLDFGLAKFVADGTDTTQAMGTPAYMAPEQLWKQRIGPWTDLYAVGVIAFEMLCGRRPFAGDADQIVQKKSSPGWDVLSEAANLGLDPETQHFLRKALAFDPGARYGDADEMARDFDILPPFVGLAAAYGAAVELDPEKLRLKRMEEQMQAERRKLDEDKRRLDHDRQQLDSQRVGIGAPAPAPLPAMAPQAPLGQPGASGSKAGVFIGLAGGVLLIGIALVVGKAYVSKDEADPAAVPAAVAPAVAPAPAAPVEPAAAAQPAADAVAAPVAAQDAQAVAAPDAVAAAAPDAALAAAEEAAVAADAESADTAAAAVAADSAPAAAPAKVEATSDAPKAEPKHEARPAPKPKKAEPVRPKFDPKVAQEAAIAEQFRKAKEDKERKEAADKKAVEDRKKALEGKSGGFQDALGKEFKKSQTK